jgi:hypothetical protein
MVPVTGNVDVVNPNLVSRLDAEGVTDTGEDLGDLDIANDDITLLKNTKSDTIES